MVAWVEKMAEKPVSINGVFGEKGQVFKTALCSSEIRKQSCVCVCESAPFIEVFFSLGKAF